jgi:hypothetical protein
MIEEKSKAPPSKTEGRAPSRLLHSSLSTITRLSSPPGASKANGGCPTDKNKTGLAKHVRWTCGRRSNTTRTVRACAQRQSQGFGLPRDGQ